MINGVKTESPATDERFGWLTPDALTRVRGVLAAVTLFVGLAVYVFHTLGPIVTRDTQFLRRLQVMGALTWLFGLVQMIDLRVYNSRFAQRRRASVGLPDSLHGVLFGQMIAWYGILYYGLTGDYRPFVAGVGILALAFWVFPIRR